MPPKKKKGKGSAKKDKPVEKPKAEPVSEESKEYYQLQIRDLEGRLERYQKKWDEICAKENFFQAQFDQLSSDKKEIVSFLKRTLNQRLDEIADLNNQLSGLQQAKDAEKDAYEAQLAQMRHEFQETKERLTSENMLLAGKLASLEEFRVQKEELMAKFAALEEKLRKQEEEHKDMMYKLEKKAVLDKDRLKKEMVQKVNTVAAEFRKVSNDQMAATTKRAIRENVAVSSQLAKMSEKSLELIQENDQLREQESDMRKQLEILEENEKEFVRNNLSNQKVIRMLTEKCQQQQEMLDLAIQREQDLDHLHVEHQSLQEEAQALRQRMTSLEEEVQRLMEERDNANKQLEEEVKKRQSVEKVLSQAASSLKDMLMEKSSGEDGDEHIESLAKRNQTLHSLLVLLDSAASLGLGPALHEFQSQDTHYVKQYMPPKRQTVSPTLKGPGVIPHYRMGDLGLVPRQDVSNAILGKIGMLSRTTKLGPLQANPALAKDLLTLSQDGKLPKPKALPGISSTSTGSALLMAK
ncbi:cilia- and flagella-associated protein 157 [Bufo gargarizans]|uniref:cilia- and flagella-associated protein 157 n=1 Tax=Bufo gargarizans TaxID=30331 RepID=UPI001CF4A088|nr:cilia- and flagella-associated protein 157 [Bufo gargarizans]